MRKIALFTALLMAVLPALVSAYPGIGGGRGLLRVQNALVEDEAGLTISVHALGRNPHFPVGNNKAYVVDLIAPELSYAPVVTKYVGLELFGSWGGVFQYALDEPPAGYEKFYMGLHDLKAGGKVSVPIIPVLKLGFAGSYTFWSDRDPMWLDSTAIPAATDPAFAWNGLATLQLQDVLRSAPNLMVNYGKTNDETRYGAGIELAATSFALFLDVLSQQGPNSTGIFDTGADTGHIHVTPGVVFGNVSNTSLKLAYTFSFGDGDESDNELFVGLSIGTPFGRRAKPEFGTIAGKVVDQRTREGIQARVSFPDDSRLAAMTTDANGVFTLDKVGVGVVVVEVEADGYGSQAVPVSVEANTVAQYEFELRPLVTYGTIAGIVTDANTNGPLAAMVDFPGTDVPGVESDEGTGSFRVDKVPVGVYTVTAEADGYFKASLTVQVEEGRVATPSFALKPLTDVSTFTGKVSDKATNAPLVATISFPGSSVGSIKSAAGTGVFSTEIPVGSYAVKVTSEGYIDQSAAIVMEKDKPQVKNFEMVKEGMSITLRGVYFDYDKATIKPESRPALEDAAKILKENPSIRVEIQGHTDSDGSDSYNQQLSDRRAAAVVSYLVRNLGIDAGRLTSRGYGESNPVASNSTAEGKALNRRVEFFILGQQK